MPNVDIYSDSDDIIPATPDIASDTSSDDADKRVESKKLKNIENKIADTKITEKASTSREQMLTGSEWLKLIESRRGIYAHTCKIWISPVSDRTYLNVLDMMKSPEV